VHVVAALDERGALLGVESVEASVRGDRAALRWLRRFGTVELVGVEGTGSYGAGLTRHLLGRGILVVEVDGPNRQRRRTRGKSDPQDAVTAARAAQAGDGLGAAKTRDGHVEAMRVLRVGRSAARTARTQALNQMRSISPTRSAPSCDTSTSTGFSNGPAPTGRPGPRRRCRDQTDAADAGRRAAALEDEVDEIDTTLESLVADTAPELVPRVGVGTDTAAAVLVAGGRQPRAAPQRSDLRSPVRRLTHRASSRTQQRHRLNRGGDRRANSALWKIVLTRMVCDPRTRAYIERRMEEGHTNKEAIRCLKRYVARQVYNHLPRPELALDSP
jgi:transposase